MPDDANMTTSFTSEEPPLVVVGQTGERGRPGRAGPAGPSSVLSAKQVISLFVFVLGVFLILAWRIQLQTNALSQSTYDLCSQSQANAMGLNTLLDQIIVVTKTNTDIPMATRMDFVAKYAAAKPRIVNCGTAP